MTNCPVCKQPIDDCPYGGDCGEIAMIARQRQVEINADIDIDDMDECMQCGKPCEHSERLCYTCTHGDPYVDYEPEDA